MKSKNGPWLPPWEIAQRSTHDVPNPREIGGLIPGMAILNAFLPVHLRNLGSSSRPIRNREKMDIKVSMVP